jgi:hypothetical protein
MNAAQGMITGAIGIGNTGQIISAQQHAYNQALQSSGTLTTGDSFRLSPRIRLEVDRVSNGYVIAVGSERMIAKDLEELQQHFTAQVVSKLVLDEGK